MNLLFKDKGKFLVLTTNIILGRKWLAETSLLSLLNGIHYGRKISLTHYDFIKTETSYLSDVNDFYFENICGVVSEGFGTKVIEWIDNDRD
jgi:hypothetical protein